MTAYTFDVRKLIEICRKNDVEMIGVFGSTARGESNEQIAGMRDKLAHHYFGVDLEKVWLTAQDDLPTLKEHVRQILHEIQRAKGRQGNDG